jgi:predicted porin
VRKYLAIVLGVMLVLGFAATASAMDTEVTLGGKIMVRGWYLKNVHHGVPEDTASQAWYDTEASIDMDIKVEENVRGFMELETSAYGDPYSGEYVWGHNGYDQKPNADLYFRQLWIMYYGSGLLGVPAGIKVGHMPVSLGEKQFLNNERFGNDMILAWVDPTKELHIAGAIAKLVEGDPGPTAYHTDDVDGYVLLATYALDKDNTIGLNWTYIHSDGYCPALDYDAAAGVVPNVDKLNFHNLGIHGNGDISGLSWGAEVDWQFGKVTNLRPPEVPVATWTLPTNELKAKGWAAFVNLGYMIDPINIRGEFAYGSGDDNLLDGDCKEFQTLQGPDEIEPASRLVHYTQIYERTINTASLLALLTTSPDRNSRNTGIANTTYFRLGMDWAATPALDLALDGFWLKATKTGAWEDLLGRPVDSALGWELDFKGTYNIAKNLDYFVEAAGFWPGDFYKDVYGDDETVTQLIHGLVLHF